MIVDTPMHTTPDPLQTDIQYLKGVGAKWRPAFRKRGLETVGDLLHHYPRRYEDRSNLPPISELKLGVPATVRGYIQKVGSRPTRGGKVIIKAVLTDGTGSVALVWFNQPWIKRKLENYDNELIAYGVPKQEDWVFTMQNPEIEIIEDEEDADQFARIVPVYALTEGLPQSVVRRAATSALTKYLDQIDDPLSAAFRAKHKLRPLTWCLKQIHSPDNMENQKEARRRLVFEEFFYMQMGVQMRRSDAKHQLGITFRFDGKGESDETPGGTLFTSAQDVHVREELQRLLPFKLTGAQNRVIGEIFDDMQRPMPMNRLVQGDVGSGKTAVAAAAILAAIRCGYQAAMMAPTEILAEQHFSNLRRLFEPLGIHVALLTGRLNATKKKKAQQQAASGEAQLVVGTHALITDSVGFAKLGLAVIDEQHRFGVAQRAELHSKGTVQPDVLVMTATPIPRTLTMTMYGDLDVSVIDELPPGRTPIKTLQKMPHERKAVYNGVRKIVDEGRQAYIVCPAIDESEKITAQAAVELHRTLSTDFFPDLEIGLLHGQMKPIEKDEVMERFRAGAIKILVSTVVIEVGVDVPNATVMVIEDAHRFGLAQLHQLRGRVGRGDKQSFCVLISNASTEDGVERIRTMTETTDGFKIAEVDLRLRGPGEVAGTRQSGTLDFRIADLVQDSALLEVARQAALEQIEDDPHFEKKENAALLEKIRQQRQDWSVVTVA